MMAWPRLFHIAAINEKSGDQTLLTRYATDHDSACENLTRFSRHPARRVQLKEVSAANVPLREWMYRGFVWVFDEDGGHYFQRKEQSGGYSLLRCLPEDLLNGNFDYFTRHKLTRVETAASKACR